MPTTSCAPSPPPPDENVLQLLNTVSDAVVARWYSAQLAPRCVVQSRLPPRARLAARPVRARRSLVCAWARHPRNDCGPLLSLTLHVDKHAEPFQSSQCRSVIRGGEVVAEGSCCGAPPTGPLRHKQASKQLTTCASWVRSCADKLCSTWRCRLRVGSPRKAKPSESRGKRAGWAPAINPCKRILRMLPAAPLALCRAPRPGHSCWMPRMRFLLGASIVHPSFDTYRRNLTDSKPGSVAPFCSLGGARESVKLAGALGKPSLHQRRLPRLFQRSYRAT